MEAFYTIQGEGYHTGKAAYFIRVGGCDIGCHWCDVKESWDAARHPLTDVDTIVAQALEYPGKAVVITGGEPLIYNLNPLTRQLQAAGVLTFLKLPARIRFPVPGIGSVYRRKNLKAPGQRIYGQPAS